MTWRATSVCPSTEDGHAEVLIEACGCLEVLATHLGRRLQPVVGRCKLNPAEIVLAPSGFSAQKCGIMNCFQQMLSVSPCAPPQ